MPDGVPKLITSTSLYAQPPCPLRDPREPADEGVEASEQHGAVEGDGERGGVSALDEVASVEEDGVGCGLPDGPPTREDAAQRLDAACV